MNLGVPIQAAVEVAVVVTVVVVMIDLLSAHKAPFSLFPV
jgi:hypothetical protein